MTDRPDRVAAATEWIYEAARLEAKASGRPIVPEPWEDRDPAFREQMVRYVGKQIATLAAGEALPTPEAAHEDWCREYARMGWRWGPVRDPAAKTHPDLVPYAELSPAEREKDEIFLELVRLAARWIVHAHTA
jgi:hypothetical protein